MTRADSRRPLIRLAALALPIALWLLAPAAASALCAMPLPIEQAIRESEIVLVGTVTSTENMGRWATVQVHEIWKGPDLPATVVVLGGPEPGAASSIDRSFTAGARYLLVVSADEQGRLHDNACSATTEIGEGENKLRPADFRTPGVDDAGDAGVDLGGIAGAGLVAILVAAVLLGVGLVARGRQTS
jgi:hypothetical protein